MKMKILIGLQFIIIIGLIVHIINLNKELAQAQKIVDTFATALDSGNFETAQSIKDTWWKIFGKNNYIITGKYCDRDESGACVE